jgi:alpha-D-xyloside xylohydrolase
VYSGKDSLFNLYEDENVNYNYEKGKFSIIPFVYDEEKKTLTIGKRQGRFNGMIETRKFEIVWITKKDAKALNFDKEPDETITYNGNEIRLKLK